MIRSILAVLTGVIVFFLIVGTCDGLVFAWWPTAVTLDHQHVVSRAALWVMMYYWLVATTLGCAVAGLLAKRAQRGHAVAVSVVLALYFLRNAFNAVGTVDPVWWHVLLVVLALPAALVGALPWRASSRHAAPGGSA